MKSSSRERKDPATHQLDCAKRVVSILFELTGLATMLREEPVVIVGDGNWISFTVQQRVSSEAVLGLRLANGKPAFVADVLDRRAKARSRTSPSLHLTNLGSGEVLRGHVDAHYWAKHPLAHADEYLRKTTKAPSELLSRLQDEGATSRRRR